MKRLISMKLFDDPWFFGLSDKAKLFWLFYLTKCDHAGFLEFNEPVVEFYMKSPGKIYNILEEFGNCFITVRGRLFSPKFVLFQYPNFDANNSLPAISAKKILNSFGIDPNSIETLNQECSNTQGKGKEKGIIKEQGKEKVKEEKTIEKNSKNQVSITEVKMIFDYFRKSFPGSKNGLDSEFENFRKKNPDYITAVYLLDEALLREKEWREKNLKAGAFVPAWKNLSTWINNRCWLQELSEAAPVETPSQVKTLVNQVDNHKFNKG